MKIPRQPNGPAEREKRLQKIVTTFIRHERIEGHHEYLDETRQYAEQVTLVFAILLRQGRIVKCKPRGGSGISGKGGSYRQIQTLKDYYRFTFFPRIIDWNALPANIPTLPTLAQFSVVAELRL